MSFFAPLRYETTTSLGPAVDGYLYSATFDAEAFATGGCRVAFKGTYNGTIPNIGPRNRKPCVTKVFLEQHRDHIRGWTPDIKTSNTANEIANKFNEFCPTNKPITFQVPIICRLVKLGHNRGDLSVQAPNSNKKAYLRIGDTVAVEDFLDGKYEKFNSNNGWVSRESTLMPAFSHYSWWCSDGQLVVCDLQGVRRKDCYLLTDPAVHSMKEEYGITDLGAQGIAYFFSSHLCNNLCAELPRPISYAGAQQHSTSKNTSFARKDDPQRINYNAKYNQNWDIKTDRLELLTIKEQ